MLRNVLLLFVVGWLSFGIALDAENPSDGEVSTLQEDVTSSSEEEVSTLQEEGISSLESEVFTFEEEILEEETYMGEEFVVEEEVPQFPEVATAAGAVITEAVQDGLK